MKQDTTFKHQEGENSTDQDTTFRASSRRRKFHWHVITQDTAFKRHHEGENCTDKSWNKTLPSNAKVLALSISIACIPTFQSTHSFCPRFFQFSTNNLSILLSMKTLLKDIIHVSYLLSVKLIYFCSLFLSSFSFFLSFFLIFFRWKFG